MFESAGNTEGWITSIFFLFFDCEFELVLSVDLASPEAEENDEHDSMR